MSRSLSNREIEIKLRIANLAAIRSALKRAGFRIVRRRVFEDNIVFDTPDLTLFESRKLLRLRQAGRLNILTYKGPPAAGRYKSREELELHFDHMDTMRKILNRMGLQPLFRYQKYRTEYAQPDRAGLVLLDRTPIGDFLELEGPPRWIDRAAGSLGFRRADFLTASYHALYEDYCRAVGSEPGEMIFR